MHAILPLDDPGPTPRPFTRAQALARGTTRPQLERLLEDVRRKGYAYSNNENFNGLASVAAPVRDSTGRARAAVSVAGPSSAFEGCVERVARVVIITANKLAHRLAW